MTIRPSSHLLHNPSIIEAIVRTIRLDNAQCIHVIDTILFLGLGLNKTLRGFVP